MISAQRSELNKSLSGNRPVVSHRSTQPPPPLRWNQETSLPPAPRNSADSSSVVSNTNTHCSVSKGVDHHPSLDRKFTRSSSYVTAASRSSPHLPLNGVAQQKKKKDGSALLLLLLHPKPHHHMVEKRQERTSFDPS